jgi:hypothetical protein
MNKKTKLQVSGTYGKKKCRITYRDWQGGKAWVVQYPGGQTLGFAYWEHALMETLRYWRFQK